MEKSRNRRRSLVVNRSVQKRIVFAVILVPTLGLAVSTMVVAYFCRRLLAESLAFEAELPSLTPLLVSVLAFFVVCSIVMGIQGLRFSHRIAGPAYRICQSLIRIRDHDIGFRVSLRHGDYLTEIADELNATLDYLNANPPAGAKTGGDVVDVHTEGDSEDSSPDAEGGAPASAASVAATLDADGQ